MGGVTNNFYVDIYIRQYVAKFVLRSSSVRFTARKTERKSWGLICSSFRHTVPSIDESPILVFSCGHFFTSETLDGCLELHKAYSVDHQGHYTGLIDPEGQLDEQTPKFSAYHQPFLQYDVRRYGRVISHAANDQKVHRQHQ